MIEYSQVFFEWIMGTKFKPPPLPLLLALAVFLLGIVVGLKYKPDFLLPGKEKFFVLTILGVIAVLVIYVRWVIPMPCSLFKGPRSIKKYDSAGSLIGSDTFNENCGKNTIGRVKVGVSGTTRKGTEYFCKDHDPEIGWMRKWLERQRIEADLKTIKRFSGAGTDDDDFDLDSSHKF